MLDDSEPAPESPTGLAGWSLAERTARRGQDQLRDLVRAACAKALVRTVVLAVDRNQLSPGGSHRFDNQLAARHQHLFVGQSDAFSEADRLVGRFQPSTPTIADITNRFGRPAASTRASSPLPVRPSVRGRPDPSELVLRANPGRRNHSHLGGIQICGLAKRSILRPATSA